MTCNHRDFNIVNRVFARLKYAYVSTLADVHVTIIPTAWNEYRRLSIRGRYFPIIREVVLFIVIDDIFKNQVSIMNIVADAMSVLAHELGHSVYYDYKLGELKNSEWCANLVQIFSDKFAALFFQFKVDLDRIINGNLVDVKTSVIYQLAIEHSACRQILDLFREASKD